MRTGSGMHHLRNRLIMAAALLPARLSHRLVGPFCPIFMLHRFSSPGIDGHDPRHVERCLQYVRAHGYHAWDLEALAMRLRDGGDLPPRSVCFTIDDGFCDHAEVGGTLFARYEIPLTCFVVTDFLDGLLWPWDDQVALLVRGAPAGPRRVTLPDGSQMELKLGTERNDAIAALQDAIKLCRQDSLYAWLDDFYHQWGVFRTVVPSERFTPMSWADARDFIARGHRIAPHTRSHRILSRLDETSSGEEIRGSIERVEAETGMRPLVFAYPTGRPQDFGPREMDCLAAHGVVAAVSTCAQTCRPGDVLHALPRLPLPDDFGDFVQYLSFIECAKEKLRNMRTVRA